MPPPISQPHDDAAGDAVSALGAVWANAKGAAAIAIAVSVAGIVSVLIDCSFVIVSEMIGLFAASFVAQASSFGDTPCASILRVIFSFILKEPDGPRLACRQIGRGNAVGQAAPSKE